MQKVIVYFVVCCFILIGTSLQVKYSGIGVKGKLEVYIPDENFKQALLDDWTINKDRDDKITQDEALNRTKIDVSNNHIKDLTGILAFKNLELLACSFNDLTSL